MNFYPRPPRGGRQKKGRCRMNSREFLSTPSARRATSVDFPLDKRLFISIHALREEGDTCPVTICSSSTIFLSTPSARRATVWSCRMQHTPITFLSTPSARRATTINQLRQAFQVQFLSTPSARRATCVMGYITIFTERISIHALREEGDTWTFIILMSLAISIHALREEGDLLQTPFIQNNF